MADRAELERKLADLKAELDQVEGRPTEVYSRIVGYYRSVRNWNAGKRAEYSRRQTFAMPGLPDAAPVQALRVASPPGGAGGKAGSLAANAAVAAASGAPTQVAGNAAREGRPERSGVLVFTRKACPNCPPVADFVTHAGLPAVFVDVDGDEGLALARRHGILSTPTVLGLDGAGRESFRACGLAELKERLPGFGLGTC